LKHLCIEIWIWMQSHGSVLKDSWPSAELGTADPLQPGGGHEVSGGGEAEAVGRPQIGTGGMAKVKGNAQLAPALDEKLAQVTIDLIAVAGNPRGD
jgi:hypothetical protein